MPIKVKDDSRNPVSWSCVDVPSVEDMSNLSGKMESEANSLRGDIKWLHEQRVETFKRHDGHDERMKDLAGRMLDRKAAEDIRDELKQAMADTSVFTAELHKALEAHEQRLRTTCEQSRQTVESLRAQTHDELLAAQACLDTQRAEAAAASHQFAAEVAAHQTINATTRQQLDEARTHAAELAALRQGSEQERRTLQEVTAWSQKLRHGGFWARLAWLIKG